MNPWKKTSAQRRVEELERARSEAVKEVRQALHYFNGWSSSNEAKRHLMRAKAALERPEVLRASP